MQKVLRFIKEAQAELKKVQWPTQKELVRYTVAVIIMSLAVAIFLGVLDQIFRGIIETYILKIK